MNHVTQWMDDERIEIISPRKRPEKVFIRFGKWSRGQRSYNFATRTRERGLSVYNARMEADDTVSLIADDESMIDGITATECAALLADRLAFVVTGKEICRGSDGEPILIGVKMLPYAIRPESMPKEIRRRLPATGNVRAS